MHFLNTVADCADISSRNTDGQVILRTASMSFPYSINIPAFGIKTSYTEVISRRRHFSYFEKRIRSLTNCDGYMKKMYS